VSLRDEQYEEKLQQFRRVEQFFENLEREKRRVNKYQTPDEFKEHLRQHLQRLIWQKLGTREPGGFPDRRSPSLVAPTLELLEEQRRSIQRYFNLFGASFVLALAAALYSLTKASAAPAQTLAGTAVVAIFFAILLGLCWSCDSRCSTVRALLVTRRWEDALKRRREPFA
jgi:hypothetical protein